MLVSLKGGLEISGGMAVPLFSLSQRFVYLLHWHASRESVSVLPLFSMVICRLWSELLLLVLILPPQVVTIRV